MKAKDLLLWIVKQAIEGEKLGTIEVPNDDRIQTEEWWYETMGGCPPAPIKGGLYMYYYSDCISDMVEDENGSYTEPDAEIELSEPTGFSYIYLYRIDD